MNADKAFYAIFASFIIALVLFGCGSQTEKQVSSDIAERSLFSGCTLPCWLGIELNQTTEQEAKEILITHYGVYNVDDTVPPYVRWSTTKPEEVSRGGWVKIHDNIVVSVNVKFRQGAIVVDNLIGDMGYPEYVETVQTADRLGCAGAYLHYPSLGISAILFPHQGKVGVFGDQSVNEIDLITPGGQLMPLDSWIEEWKGYGDYCPDE